MRNGKKKKKEKRGEKIYHPLKKIGGRRTHEEMSFCLNGVIACTYSRPLAWRKIGEDSEQLRIGCAKAYTNAPFSPCRMANLINCK